MTTKKSSNKKSSKKPAKTKTVTRRGAPDVVERRKVARSFNTLFGGDVKDGRMERKTRRLLAALKFIDSNGIA